MIKVAAIYSDGVDARYVSCADKAVFRTEEVLKYGVTMKNLDPWCPDKKAPGQVQAAPGEIVMFVRSMKGMPAAEIRVRLIDIETGKPAKDLYVEVRRIRVPTSVDGVARFSVPAPSSREIRDIGPIFVSSSVYPSSERYASCSGSAWFQTEEVLRYGVMGKNLAPWCPGKKALDEVEATPGEIVMFVRPFTWRERIKHWFSDS
jgi:hypothetical protein